MHVEVNLSDRIDAELVNDLEAGLGWIDRSGLPLVLEPEETLPWLPPNYLAALLLSQWHFDAHVPIKGDRDRWQQLLLLAGRPAEAMEVALHRLRVAEVVSWPWHAIAASDPQRLLRTVQLPGATPSASSPTTTRAQLLSAGLRPQIRSWISSNSFARKFLGREMSS
ncbi:MAG: hypothetical protein NTZ40_08485 [Cyanobacteria bacterium]|nr:hypothetical protein [Cyanobacteriota bacterium]